MEERGVIVEQVESVLVCQGLSVRGKSGGKVALDLKVTVVTTSQHHRGLPWIEIATNNNNFGPRLQMPLL